MLVILFLLGGVGVIAVLAFITIEIGAVFFTGWLDLITIKKYLMALLISCVVVLFSILGLKWVNSYTYSETKKTGEYELIPMNPINNNPIYDEERDIYIAKNIDNQYYSFYYKTDNGIKRGSIEVNKTTIYREENENPYLVVYTTTTKSKMNGILYRFLTFTLPESTEDTYELNTKMGSLIEEYPMNSQ